MDPSDEEHREASTDPDFDSFFRPDEQRTSEDPADSRAAAQAGSDDPSQPNEPAQQTDAAAEQTAAAESSASEAIDTGRLFRSQGVSGNELAVLAIPADQGRRLRTLSRTDAQAPDAPVVRGRSESVPLAPGTPAVQDDVPVTPARRSNTAARQAMHRSAGISAGAVYIIIIGVTFIVGVINAWLGKGELGWPTGVALLLSTVYCAWRVRRQDDIVAILTPALAFFITAVTAGQFFRGATGGGLLNRAQLVFFTFSYNWYWVIGATVVALVLVLVRRNTRA